MKSIGSSEPTEETGDPVLCKKKFNTLFIWLLFEFHYCYHSVNSYLKQMARPDT